MPKILPIITLPKKSLRLKSSEISEIDPATKTLISQMQESTLEWEAGRPHEVGVALAAVQIGKNMRAIIIREDFENRENKNFIAYINPKITKYSGDKVLDYEGCLSVKDIYGLVPRYPTIEFTALTIDGDLVSETATGFMARVIQHEVDHTNGIVFIDHIKDEDAFFRLAEDGNLIKVDHEEIIKSPILW